MKPPERVTTLLDSRVKRQLLALALVSVSMAVMFETATVLSRNADLTMQAVELEGRLSFVEANMRTLQPKPPSEAALERQMNAICQSLDLRDEANQWKVICNDLALNRFWGLIQVFEAHNLKVKQFSIARNEDEGWRLTLISKRYN